MSGRPDGDDPDSYIRKVGGQAFKDYIKASQKDFIRFKTELALLDIGDDPIKKAELIGDLVDSIVKIPSEVKRSVFYQEVSKLLNIDETILLNEGNKKLRNKAKDKSNQFAPSEFVPYEHPKTAIDLSPQTFDADEKLVSQEEAMVKILLLYGEKTIEINAETGIPTRIADYILSETSELNVKHQISKKIYDLYKHHYEKGELPALSVFTSNEDHQIQEKVIDWLSPKHELSEKWQKYEIFVAKTENVLAANPEFIVMRIFLESTQKEIDKLIDELETASETDQDIILNAIEKKRSFKTKLADMLGVVVG